jgi:hypothetical protein
LIGPQVHGGPQSRPLKISGRCDFRPIRRRKPDLAAAPLDECYNFEFMKHSDLFRVSSYRRGESRPVWSREREVLDARIAWVS